jgi:hypothetical protein
MSVETQHSDDDSSIKNYEWFSTDSGSVHYKTDNHHVGITEDSKANYLYFNE